MVLLKTRSQTNKQKQKKRKERKKVAFVSLDFIMQHGGVYLPQFAFKFFKHCCFSYLLSSSV